MSSLLEFGFEGGTAMNGEEEFREVRFFSQDYSDFGDSGIRGSSHMNTRAMLRCAGLQCSFFTCRKTTW